MKRIGLIIAFIFCAVISYGQQIHSGGINIATGFKLSDPQPIDDRYVVQDSLSLLSIPNIYTGLWAYSLADSSVFVYDGVKWERIVDMELAMTLISTFPKDTNTLNEVLAKGDSITADREIVSTNMDLGFMNFDEFVINANNVTMDVNDSVLVKVNGKGVSVKEDSVEINVRTRYKDAYTFANDRDLPDVGWVKQLVADSSSPYGILYIPQDLDEEEKAQARDNIGMTSNYKQYFIYNETDNPTKVFTLDFSPTNVHYVFADRTPLWGEDVDETEYTIDIEAKELTIDYAITDGDKIVIYYEH